VIVSKLDNLNVFSVFVKEALVFAGTSSAIYIVDVSNVRLPKIINSISGNFLNPIVQDDILLLLDLQHVLHLINISDSYKPQAIGNVTTRGYGIAVVEDQVVVIGRTILQIVNISDVQYPRIVGSLAGFENNIDLDVQGDLVIVASLSALYFVNISNSQEPLKMHQISTSALGVAIQGALTFVTTANGVIVLDITDPMAPQFVGQVQSESYVYSTLIIDNLMLLGSGGGLLIMDLGRWDWSLIGVPSRSEQGTNRSLLLTEVSPERIQQQKLNLIIKSRLSGPTPLIPPRYLPNPENQDNERPRLSVM